MLGYANLVCVCVYVCVSCAQIATGSSPVHAYHFTVLIASVNVREREGTVVKRLRIAPQKNQKRRSE